MANTAQLLAARRKQNKATLTGGTAYLPGGSTGGVTGAHLPGGVGTPGVFTPTTPKPVEFKPSIPAPPAVNPLVQTQLDNTVTGVNATLTNTLAGLTAQQTNSLLDYGYTAAPGANGELDLSTLKVDPNNPFSKAALLQRSFDQAQRGNRTSYAARGHLYSGALQNAQNESRHQFEAGSNQLQRGLGGTLAELARRRQTAKTTANNQITSAQDLAALTSAGLK